MLVFRDGTSVCVIPKRLEESELRSPKIADGAIRLSMAQPSALLESLDWRCVRSMETWSGFKLRCSCAVALSGSPNMLSMTC